MAASEFDLNDLKRRMQGALSSLKQELSGLRTGRASTWTWSSSPVAKWSGSIDIWTRSESVVLPIPPSAVTPTICSISCGGGWPSTTQR